MSYLDTATGSIVSSLSVDQRAAFIRKTYAHVAMGIAAMAFSCVFLLQVGAGPVLLSFLSGGTLNYLIYFGVFVGAGVLADNWARSEHSTTMHYIALLGYAFVEAVVATPLLYLASLYNPAAIMDAAITTAALVAGLTLLAFTTKKDFSFLRPFLLVGSIIAMGACVAGAVFGFNLGLLGISAIVLLSAGFVLYNTSNIIHVYKEHQYVAAALGLFASIALMFRFVLQMFMSFGDD